MKIDKKAVDMLSSLPDDSLWRVICSLGASSGLDLSGVSVTPEQLNKVRLALGSLTDEDISHAVNILDKFNGKNAGGGNG